MTMKSQFEHFNIVLNFKIADFPQSKENLGVRAKIGWLGVGIIYSGKEEFRHADCNYVN